MKSFEEWLKSHKYNIDKIAEEDEVLKEMAIEGYGDWNPSIEMIGSMSTFILEKQLMYITELIVGGTVYRIYKQKNVYIAGYFVETSEDETKFQVDFEIKLSEDKSTANDFKITKPLMNVDGVRVQETARGYGIATSIYKFLVKH